jgi:hypothetical protein
MKQPQASAPDNSREVRRRIKLAGPVDPEEARVIEEALVNLPGLRQARVNSKRRLVDIRYDVALTDYLSLLKILEEVGYPSLRSWWSRCKRGWFAFTEENMRQNAKAPPPPCCNKPPK